LKKKYGTQSLTAGNIYNAPRLRIKNKKGVIFFSCWNKTHKTLYIFPES